MTTPHAELKRLAEDGVARATGPYTAKAPYRHADVLSLIEENEKMREALVAARREMWRDAAASWTREDFNNWAIVQQIDRALRSQKGEG